jgi:inositol transport system ATP-binding protein
MSLVEMRNISKSFTGTKVLNKVNLYLEEGTVHALIGENGAGKSTLMRILTGNCEHDEGEIIINGNCVKIDKPAIALEYGIAMIYQELTPIYEMTVAENIFLGREPQKYKFINYAELNSKTRELLNRLQIQIDPSRRMRDLALADIQLIEIAKAISHDSKIIVMDEPTSALTEVEVERLLSVIKELKEKGKCIVYISHKLEEVFKISDVITVLRDGECIDTVKTNNVEITDIIKMMVGRELNEIFTKETAEPGDVVLAVKNLSQHGKFSDISFDVKQGEILGVSGLMGSGRTEVAKAIAGITKLDAGDIYINGKNEKIRSPGDAIQKGIAYVTEDRKREGLDLYMSVKENISISSLNELIRFGFINDKKEKRTTDEYIDQLKIKAKNRDQEVQYLSGGNQQKVVISKWLMTKPKVLILDEPTRGIDVGAKAEIYKLMNRLAHEGLAIVMISSELPEILAMSDRILVFHNRRLTGELSRSDATQIKIMGIATGQIQNGGDQNVQNI